MRPPILAALLLACAAVPASAQHTFEPGVPRVIGNRANGNSYQPTPNEVLPREKAAGIAPTQSQRKQTGHSLWHADTRLLKSEGLTAKSVPDANAANHH